MEANNTGNEAQILIQSKLMASSKSNLYGLIKAIKIIAGVTAGILIGLPLFSGKSLPSGAGTVTLISAILFIILLISTPIMFRSSKKIKMTLETNPNKDIIFRIEGGKEPKVILNPDKIEYYYYIEQSGANMDLIVKHLVFCVIKDKKYQLVLEESYGHGISPPLSWQEKEERHFTYDSPAFKDISYRVMDFNKSILERTIKAMDEL